MKKLLCLAPVVLLLAPAVAPAEEEPEVQLEFARRLRSRRMSDLALEHLEKLQKNPPAKIAALLPLEIARTRVSLARERPAAERAALLATARKGLAEYAAKSAGKPDAVHVKLEMARVTSYEGQALLSLAYRQEDKEAQEDYLRKARAKFDEAKQEFDAAIASAEKAAAAYRDADPRQEQFVKTQIVRDILHARYDKAKIFIDEANSYLDTKKTQERLKRSKLLEAARDQLNKVASDSDPRDPKKIANVEVAYLSFAWLMRIHQQLDAPDVAKNLYQKLLENYQSLPAEAAEGVRWSRYFFILGIHDDPAPKMPQGWSKTQYIWSLAKNWLADYPAHHTTAVGQGIRFEYAKASFELAQKIAQDYNNAQARPLYDEALSTFQKIAASDSDLAEKSREYVFAIKMLRVGKNAPVASLTNFDDCVARARFEMTALAQTLQALNDVKTGAKREKLLQKKDEQFRVIVAAFQRALTLADFRTPPHEVDDVRYFLTYVYLVSGDPYRAAVMGEHLATREPPSKRAPLAAMYAIQAYRNVVDLQDDEANRRKLQEMIDFVLSRRAKDWASDPVVPMARYQLAMIKLRERKYDETIAELKKLPKDFRLYTFAQCQLALAAYNAMEQAEKVEKTAEAKKYKDEVLATLRALPALPKEADAATAAMFFTAQIIHGRLLYIDAFNLRKDNKLEAAGAKYAELSAFADSLLKQFEGLKADLGSKAKGEIGERLDYLSKLARLGRGEMEYLSGNYDKVLATDLTGSVIERVEMLAKANKSVKLPDHEIVGEILGLAMRAHVQKGTPQSLKKAEDLLALLPRLESAEGTPVNPTTVLQRLIAELQIQVKTLRATNDKARLEATAKNFGKFFDALLAKGGPKLDRNTVFFLAQSYSTLGEHLKAADLYGKMEKPAAFDANAPMTAEEQAEYDAKVRQAVGAYALQYQARHQKPFDPKETILTGQDKLDFDRLVEKAKEDFQKFREEKHRQKLNLWWVVQVYRAKELRLAGKADDAYRLLEQVLNDPKAVGKTLAQKERIHVFEDKQLYGRALTEWNSFLPALRGQVRDDPKMKEMYFESYFHYTRCWYLYGKNKYEKDKNRASYDKYLQRAADYIIRLETASSAEGWDYVGEQFRQLLLQADDLNQVYQRMKKEAKPSS